MLRRKAEALLENWKLTKDGQGLLVTGARQVGKTSTVEEFAARHYEHMLKIDFVEQPGAVEVISAACNLNDLVMRITALSSNPIAPGKTLLFFDEVQRCGDAITWMRYLAQDERFDVIYSGSMLGVESFDFRSLPVGTIDIVEMFPLDFEEFSWAYGAADGLWQIVRECKLDEKPVPDFIHNKLSELFWLYVLVGGMPEAVQSYVSTNDTQLMRARQRSILNAYRADITRYVKGVGHSQRIKTIYDAMPAQLNKENKRFIVSGMDKSRRFLELRPDFDWLVHAGVAISANRVTEPVFPLGLTAEGSFFKLYLNDVGLLFSCFGAAEVRNILTRKRDVNLGMAFENAVAQQLRSSGHERLYYFNKRNVGEVDFLVDDLRSGEVIPVEVKSGGSSHRHAALDNLLQVKNYHLRKAFFLHDGNVERDGAITYLPLYMSGLLGHDD